jgi:hypothetical protein
LPGGSRGLGDVYKRQTLRAYHFYDIFPTNLSAIDLAYETGGDIEQFTVELQVQWWEAIKGNGPGAGGEDIN